MKQIITPGPNPDCWSAEALYAKALRYAEKMTSAGSETWEHALWSGLCLELLARAALANISPVLLAEQRNWQNLLQALGYTPTEPKFSPKSVSTKDVLTRLKDILPDFDTELQNFCVTHTGRRNAELHSGELPFDGVHGSRWHGTYYRACTVLLASMAYTLEEFFGAEESEVAQKEIAAAADEAAKAVIGEVEAHHRVWASKSDDERVTLSANAKTWATRHLGHRVECPSCNNKAIVIGEAIGGPQRVLEEDEITETQEHLPNWFECVACGLKFTGLSRLNAVGLGDRYTKTEFYDAAEYYAPEDPYAGFEDDNNERF